MYLKTPITAAVVCGSLATACWADAVRTGMAELSIPDHDGARDLTGFLWYPTTDTKSPVDAHGNGVWESIKVVPDAKSDSQARPLVVLSHGMFGNARNQAWLAADLVAAGYVVAAVNHPGTSTFQRDPDQRRALWRRPEDVSRVIDHLTDTDGGAVKIDGTRIFVAGHSLGGHTTALLAGARYDPDRFASFCATQPAELVCDIFGSWGVAKTAADRAAMSADLSDDRIKGAALFDLGGTQSLSPQSLAEITVPMLVIGAPRDIHGIDLDVESRALVAALPEQTTTYLEPATLAHFDFLGVCTEKALEILEDEEPEDVFVCQEGREERRAEHNQISKAVISFFSGL